MKLLGKRRDPVTQLKEHCDSKGRKQPGYKFDPTSSGFMCTCTLANQRKVTAEGRSKGVAKYHAARGMLVQLNITPEMAAAPPLTTTKRR